MAAIDNTKKSARLLASRRYTHDTYTDAQEAFTSTLDINANEIYIDANLIPSSSLPFSGSADSGSVYSVDGLSIVKYWYRQPLTKSDTNNEVWFFLNPSGSNDGIGAQLINANQQTNFVSPKYSVSALTNANTEDATPGYGVKVIVAGTQVSTNNYVFDYKTGIVQFATTALAPSNGQVVTITAYQYVGRTLSSQIGSGTGVISSRLSRLEESTSSLNTFSASVNGHITDLNIKTGSLEQKNIIIAAYTASMNTFTSSQEGKDVIISAYTASMNTFSASVNGHIADLNTYTASLRTAFTASGVNITFNGDQTIKGNLYVQGTQTQVDSTTINLADNILQLNAAGTNDGGLVVRDATGGSTTSGSLLWDVTNDHWKAGASGTEERILRAGGGDHIVSGSVQVDVTSTTGFTTYSGSISSSLTSNSASISALSESVASVTGQFSSSVASTFVTQSQRITSLETFSGSQEAKDVIISAYTASMNTFTSSQEAKDVIISAYTSSMNTFTASVNGHISDINTKTGSFEGNFITLSGYTASMNTFTSSQEAKDVIISAYTSSMNTFTSSQEAKDVIISAYTASMNVFSSSQEAKDVIISAYTASMNVFSSSQEAKDVIISAYTASMNVFSSSQEAKDVIISAYTASMNTFSASVNGHIADLNTKTGSLEQKNTIIAAYTASMNTFTSSQEAKDVIISAYTASMNTFTASIYSFTQSFSQSVSTSFSASEASVFALSTSVDNRLDVLEGTGTIQGVGTTNQVTFAKVTTTGDIVVGGDLVVQGNTVTLNTATLIVEDKLISLASGSTNAATANGAGIEILGANVTFTYDSTPNAWTANIPISASAVTASVNVPGFGGSKRMAFRSTIGNLDFVDAPTTAGDIAQWDGTNFVMSNVIDGGTY